MTDLFTKERTQTNHLFRDYFANPDNQTSHRVAVANVFRAYPFYALQVDQIFAVIVAIECFRNDADNRKAVQQALTDLVRAKVLRSRRVEGKTLYEVNY